MRGAPPSPVQIVMMLAHDLKDPLHTIHLAASILSEDLIPTVADRRTEREHLHIINRSVQRMTSMVHDLLDVNAAREGDEHSRTWKPLRVSLPVADS